MNEAKKINTMRHIEKGNPVIWHRIIMSAAVAGAGLMILFAVIMNHLNKESSEALANRSVILSEGNRTLPEGDYYIYRVFLDPELNTHYLVSSMHGGVVISVVPPANTPEPENIVAISKYDSASYIIHVNSEGMWDFYPTPVLKGILQKINEVPEDETITRMYSAQAAAENPIAEAARTTPQPPLPSNAIR